MVWAGRDGQRASLVERLYVGVLERRKPAAGSAGSAAHGGGLASLKKNCVEKFTEGGALTVTPRRDDEECCAFDVTRCKFAELYKELGCADLGAVLSCERDAAFLEGFDESLELIRSETLMEGGSRCDFCYRKRG